MSPTEGGSRAERDALVEALSRHRGFLLYTAEGLTEEQARTRSTASELTIASLLRQRVDEVAQETESVLRTADLELSHRLPDAPWFESRAEWSLRRVALHVLAEISQHAGHADITREAIDGQRTMG